MLPVFKLLTPIDALEAPSPVAESAPHGKAAGAMVQVYEIEEGRALLTFWNGLLHEVIYQTPMESEDESHRRNEKLFMHYGEGHKWNELLDNGSGKTNRRDDTQRYALWSYAMDFNTLRTTKRRTGCRSDVCPDISYAACPSGRTGESGRRTAGRRR